MRDKFCVKFGLRKKSAFIKFSKNSVNLEDKKICKQAGKFNKNKRKFTVRIKKIAVYPPKFIRRNKLNLNKIKTRPNRPLHRF